MVLFNFSINFFYNVHLNLVKLILMFKHLLSAPDRIPLSQIYWIKDKLQRYLNETERSLIIFDHVLILHHLCSHNFVDLCFEMTEIFIIENIVLLTKIEFWKRPPSGQFSRGFVIYFVTGNIFSFLSSGSNRFSNC